MNDEIELSGYVLLDYAALIQPTRVDVGRVSAA